MDPYQELANAIIVTASRDYMRVYKKYLKTGDGYGNVMKEEQFFFTDWFSFLSEANPTYLVEAMRKKCEMQVQEEDIEEDDDDEEEMTLDNTDGHSEQEEDDYYG